MSWVSRLLALLLLFPSVALAQSNPGFVQGQVLTATQLNTAFSNKTDFPIPGINLATGVTGLLGVLNGGTGVNILAVGKPVVGNGTNSFLTGGTTGNTTTFVTSSGVLTSGHCASWDVNGNAVDSGGACGGGGGLVSSVFGRTGTVVATVNDYSFSLLSGQATLAQLPTLGANTVLGALTATTPSALAVPSCGTTSNALTWTSGTGFGCNTFAGGGSVTSVSSGNFSPLFNVSVVTPTTSPSLFFAAINQNPNLVYAGPSSGPAAAPTFRALVTADMPSSVGVGGTNGQIQFNNAGVFGGFTMSQDCTITTAGVITCTKTNNVAFANSATIDTTNASNIGSGTLALARLPANITQTIQGGIAALGTSAIGSGVCATVVTVSAAGVVATDVVSTGFNGDPTGVLGYQPTANGMLTIIPYPTANNVNFKVCNNTSASITPGAITLNWRVVR